MKVFKTESECTEYAVEQFGKLQVETGCINSIKIGPTIARYLGCEIGFAVCEEIREHEENMNE